MKAILKKINGNSLSLDNNHLQDILSNESFIELGNINYKVLNNLLDGKLIKLEELSYFDIQNMGLGRSEVDNDNLRDKLPYIRLYNKVKNHSSMIAIITYGILVQNANSKNFAIHEQFTPMVLIPVNIFFGDEILFQMISLPFVNPNISSIKKVTAHGVVNSSENLNTIYSIDKFCLNYNTIGDVKLESYLSYINIKNAKAKFTNTYLSEPMNLGYVDTKYNIEADRIINITNLNKAQRIALEKAHAGHSFELIGVEGTGKTTTLANIACDAIYNNKRVLYLSNSINTLAQVYKLLEEKELEGLAAKLYRPFSELKEKYRRKKTSGKEEEFQISDYRKLKKELIDDYARIEKYIGLQYQRINNFYVIDVLNKSISYKDLSSSFPEGTLEGISTIYHEELDGVISALKVIDKNIKRMESIKGSNFASIPSSIRVEPQEVIDILSNISAIYKELENCRDKLSKKFGIKKVENYAYLRQIIVSYRLLDKTLVPDVWLNVDETGLYEFENAKKVFEKYEDEMRKRNHLEEILANDYNMEFIPELNLEVEVPHLLSKFKENSEEDINKFLRDNDKIIGVLESFINSVSSGEANRDKMDKLIGTPINYTDDKLVEKVLAFVVFISKHQFSNLWLNLNARKEIRFEIAQVKEELDQFELVRKELNVVDIKKLNDLIDNMKFKKNFMFGDKRKKLKEDIQKALKLAKSAKTINEAYSRYHTLVGREYKVDDNPLETYDLFVRKFADISDKKVKDGLANLIRSLDYSHLNIAIVPFVNYANYYDQLNERHKLIESYLLAPEREQYNEKIEDIKNALGFSRRMKLTLFTVLKCMKENREYIVLEDLNVLKKKIKDLRDVEYSINTNSEYKRLLSKLFVGHKSDSNAINKLICNYETYVQLFNKPKYVELSFKNEKSLTSLIDSTDGICEENIDSIKNYSRYFKENTDSFYYDHISAVHEKMDMLIGQVDELDIYLDLMKALDTLEFYGLHNLYNYILEVNEKKINYVDTFLKGYYNNLLVMFESLHPGELDAESNYKLLEEIVKKEDKIIETNCKIMKTVSKQRFHFNSFKNLDYNNYINKTFGYKSLFLTTSNVLNYFIDMNAFDLVLIDDSQILDNNEYIKAMICKQVIVAGAPQVSFGITDDLLSNMKRTSTIRLNYRYIETPLTLWRNFNRLKAKIHDNYNDNYGVIITRVSLIKVVAQIFEDSSNNLKDTKINVYMEDSAESLKLFDGVADMLLDKGAKPEEIYSFLFKNLNVCGLGRHYGIDADYNILYLDDYKDMNDKYETINYLNLLCSVRRKVVICDENGYLDAYEEQLNKKHLDKEIESVIDDDSIIDEASLKKNKSKKKENKDESVDTGFMRSIYNLVKSEIEFDPHYPDECVRKIVQRLKKEDMEIKGSVGNYGLILKKNEKLYGVIFFDLESLHESSVMNIYRNKYYGGFIETTFIFLFDLQRNFEDCVKRIVNMVNKDSAVEVVNEKVKKRASRKKEVKTEKTKQIESNNDNDAIEEEKEVLNEEENK